MTFTAKLDELGKPAWIALTVLGFIIWWPLGLASLVFLIGSGRMGCWRSGGVARRADGRDRFAAWSQAFTPARSSGNKAFDEYRTETLRRLEDEERDFHQFLERLRAAKDKAEFDQFMADRRGRGPEPSPQAG